MAKISIPVIAAAAVATLVLFVVKLMANRQHVRKLQAAKVPMPDYHPVFGHFIALKESIQVLPRNTVMHVVVQHMAKQFPNGIFYLNLWPFNKTLSCW